MILDAYGRALQKTEVESMAKRGLMLPAYELFGQAASQEYGGVNPFVTAFDDGFLENPNVEHAWNSGAEPNSPYSNLNDRFAQRNPISQLNIPRDTVGLMTISMQYAQENYIVSRAIRVKRNFALRDMQFIGTATQKAFYSREFIRLRVRKIISNCLRYYWGPGRAVVYWGDERPIQRITILDPRSIIVKRILGEDRVYLIPDHRWKGILDAADGVGGKRLSPEATFLKQNLPRYWLPYIKDGKPIPLKADSYALIENDLEQFSLRGIDAPGNLPLQPVFQNLAVLEMMMAGDFSVAWMMKHMIALVSIGDPKAEGQNYTPPDQNELDKLRATFQRPDKSIWAYVDPTVDIRWIAPDPKLMDSTKFKYHMEAVEWCMGVPAVFSRSDGSFASSSLSMKPFREELTYARTDIEEQLFAKLFPQLREGQTSRKTGGDKDPEISWDTDCLKDDTIIMAELTGRYDRGALSVRSLLDGKAESFDTEVQRKLEEIKLQEKTPELFAPAFDISHGFVDGQEGPGRPAGANPGNTPEKQVGSRSPRPSKGV